MSRIVSTGSYHSDSGYRTQPFFATDLVRRYGVKAVLAIVVAALFAFSPLAVLYWFNELRCQTVAIVEPSQRVVVKPGRFQQDQQRDSAGKTALLQVICEVPCFGGGYRDLLCDEDPVRRDVQTTDSTYVRRELVYIRREGLSQLPFGLLGKPPVSVWLPAGNYEVMVVHETPHGVMDVGGRYYSYPWISTNTECSLEAHRTTVCRVPLTHYDWPGAAGIRLTGEASSLPEPSVTIGELTPFLQSCENLTAIPTPGGYLLALGEPFVEHSSEHRECSADMSRQSVVPREWTRDQLAALRNWLPESAQPARAKLSQLVDRLLWREFLEGWLCYAAAGITGLVFTRFGSIALLEPWRRRDSLKESVGLLIKIALASAGAWLLFQILTDSSGCHGTVPFRIH